MAIKSSSIHMRLCCIGGVQCNRLRFLLTEEEVVSLEIQLWDAAAHAGQGAQLASGTIQLDWPSWQPGSVNRDTVHLRGIAASKVPLEHHICRARLSTSCPS